MNRKTIWWIALLAAVIFAACATDPQPGQEAAPVQEAVQDREAELAREQAERDRQAELAREQAERERQAELARQQAERDRQAAEAAEMAQQPARHQQVSEHGFVGEVSGGGVIVTGRTGTGAAAQVPSQIQGMPVVGIGNRAFADSQLTSVAIPDGITSIGVQAFANNQLTSVTIPDSVTRIGWGAFANNQLTSVTIGNSVDTIGNWAFENNQLTSVTIPDSVTNIGHGAFRRNDLNNVTIGANASLGWHWFAGEMGEHGGRSPSVPQGFDAFYRGQGRRAGTYTHSNGQWNAQFR